jgi:polysaccharide biosynthesis protein PslG
MNVFVFNNPETTRRDFYKVKQIGFPWVKVLFRWADIENDYKGAYDWAEADRVVRTAAEFKLKVIARLDFQPWWARADQARNGPPDDYQDFADFVYAFISRYARGSTIGRVHAVQIWNEPNLSREWGDQPITRESAAEYVRLLSTVYPVAKRAGQGVWFATGGLAFTGVDDPACCQPDDQYLQWMFDAGLSGNYDVLGVNANFQCPCVEARPGSVPGYDHPAFYFRRIEQLRDVMIANGDGDKQIWATEFGWSSDPQLDPQQAEELKGEQIVQAIHFARQKWRPWIGVMAVWTMADPSWDLQDDQPYDDEHASWAITNPNGSNRPGYYRLLHAWQTGELPWKSNGRP